MALPYEDESKDPAGNAKGKAILKLLFIVFAIDALAIAGYFILTLVLGWDDMLPIIFVVIIAIITGFYCQWKMKEING